MKNLMALTIIVAAVAVTTASAGTSTPNDNQLTSHAASTVPAVAVKGLVWLGIRTSKFSDTVRFYEKTLGLKPSVSDADFRAYDLPNGDRIEVFSEREAEHLHFTTGPVAGFLVENVAQARAAMEKHGIHFIGRIHGSPTDEWSHFKGPDGNVYEITAHRGE